jgi:putative ABC transport system permease protein
VFPSLRFTLRSLAKSPLFTAATVLTLALGIGVNAAIFTLVRSILLRDLPFAQPHELVGLTLADPSGANLPQGFSGPEVRQLRDTAATLQTLSAYSPQWHVVVQGSERADGDFACYVSGNFFATLGVEAAQGRTLSPDDDREGAPPVVVVSDAFWRRHLGEKPDAVGSAVNLSGAIVTVVGIMPANFRFGDEVNCWLPLASNPFATQARIRLFQVIGRLASGRTAAQAGGEIASLLPEIARRNDSPLGSRRPLVVGLQEQIVARIRPALLSLQAAGALLLAATCANLLLLLLARNCAREHEFAVRLALGARTRAITGLILRESAVLAALGGGLGLLLSSWTLAGLLALAPEKLLPRRPEIGLDPTVLAFVAGLALAGGLIFGLIPAWRRRDADLNTVLKSGGRSPAMAHGRMRQLLVVVEVALAIVLLSSVALLGRSFIRLLRVSPGFNPDGIVAMQILASGPRYETRAQRATLYHELERRFGAVPGVVSLGAVNRLPFFAGGPGSPEANVTSRVLVEGRDYTANPQGDEPDYRVASPSYFPTMQIPLRRGRLFTWNDTGANVAVINEATARRYWPGQDPIGRRFRASLANSDTPWIEVIGVVGDVRHFNFELEPRPEVYRPYAINPLGSPLVAMRLSAPASIVVPRLRAALRELDPSLATATAITEMPRLVERSHAERRFLLVVLGAFGALTLLLATLGLYGVISQFVLDRRFEFATRAALGASPTDLARLVLRRWLVIVVPGAGIGAAFALAAGRLLQGLLFDTTARDPAAILSAVALIALLALLACWLPARRAARVDPMTVLRAE